MSSHRKRRIHLAPWVVGAMMLLVAHRVWQSTQEAGRETATAWSSLDAEELRRLYREPGGRYTVRDIQANGGQTPAERYAGFRAQHSVRTQPGDPICPITRTLANPACTWTIGGEEYQFCCPPCIDEFVRLAKEEPDRIRPARAYIAAGRSREQNGASDWP